MSFDLSAFIDSPEAPPIDDDQERSNASRNAGKNSAAEQGSEVPVNWKPSRDKPVPVVRCSAIAKSTGKRCGRWSLAGATVCVKHGAQLPNVKAHADAVVDAARMRLYGLAEDAVDVMEELMRPGTADQVRLKAAENVLNRAGIRDAVDVNVEVNHNVSMADEVQKKLETMRTRIHASEESENDEDIVDGEVVENEEM